MKSRLLRASALPLVGTALLIGGCATGGTRTAAPNVLQLGLSAGGDPCQAQPTSLRGDAAGPGDDNAYFDRAYRINCRSVTAARPVGVILSLVDRPEAMRLVAARFDCGSESTVQLAGVGAAQARRCLDRELSSSAVVVSFRRGDRLFVGAADETVLGPLENGLRTVAGIDTPRREATSIQVNSLAAAPANTGSSGGPGSFEGQALLSQAVRLNHLGRHADASRLINDALSRMPADTSPAVRAGLRLEAALADSNIRFFTTAQDHFDQANSLLPQVAGEDLAVLARKRDVYLALHHLNRSSYQEALAALDQSGPREQRGIAPLMDSAVLLQLNARRRPRAATGQGATAQRRTAGGDLSAALGTPSTNDISLQMLDVQEYWVRSVAATYNAASQRQPLSSEQALAAARAELDELVGSTRLEQAAILFLSARLHRQEGRIHERASDWERAGAALALAERDLQRSADAAGGAAAEPALADLKLERAMLLLRPGVDAAEVHQQYDAALRAVTESGATGSVSPRPIQRYLTYLIGRMDGADSTSNQERFFRAVQVFREPAVARQMSRLRDVRSSGASGTQLRELDALSRRLAGLRFNIQSIADNDPAAAAERAELERQRRAVEEQFLALQAQLGQDAGAATVIDSPATIAEVRSQLRPGEVYFKVITLGSATYAMLIAGDGATIYEVQAGQRQLEQAAATVRASITGVNPEDSRRLPYFDARASHGLFQALAGPVSDRLLGASAIVVDAGGPLQNLPAGVLVTSTEGIRDRSTYTDVAFLARARPLSQAVSPRSFVVSRGRAASQATRPFIGFSAPAQPMALAGGDARLAVGSNCRLSPAALLDFHRSWNPINPREVPLVVRSLAAPGSEIVENAAFTDASVRTRGGADGDLDDFRVLHFATHGFGENVVPGCASSPPGLLTSLIDGSSDGILGFEEIANLDLDANLVVLSACDTSRGISSEIVARAAGQAETGSTLEGLVRAFLTANSRAVMATSWQVSNQQETLDLMANFYAAGRTQPIDVALHQAQRGLMAHPTFSHPFFWAPFFIVGDSRNTLLAGAQQAQAGPAPGQAASR